jgi:glycosyltransferase involved in cell wall biosynthesis
MKILFIGVFTEGSTNNSQRDCLRKLGHDVDEFSYRSISNFNIVLQEIKDYNIILIAKGNGISSYTMKKLSENNGKIIYWFMDSIVNYTSEMIEKTRLSDIAYFDKKSVMEKGLLVNNNSRYVCEGYDANVDCLQNVKKEYDVSHIGQIYGERKSFLDISPQVKIITSAYGLQHAIEVGKSKINLNSCTKGFYSMFPILYSDASDRVYKILAAGGFLLTDDWYGRELTGLVDGEDLIIYSDIKDLKEKINKYLSDEEERNRISKNGMAKVKSLTRMQWAKEIVK